LTSALVTPFILIANITFGVTSMFTSNMHVYYDAVYDVKNAMDVKTFKTE